MTQGGRQTAPAPVAVPPRSIPTLPRREPLVETAACRPAERASRGACTVLRREALDGVTPRSAAPARSAKPTDRRDHRPRGVLDDAARRRMRARRARRAARCRLPARRRKSEESAPTLANSTSSSAPPPVLRSTRRARRAGRRLRSHRPGHLLGIRQTTPTSEDHRPQAGEGRKRSMNAVEERSRALVAKREQLASSRGRREQRSRLLRRATARWPR